MARFMRKGTTEVWFVPTIGDTSAPTAAEVGAGTDLTAELQEITGFSFSNSPIDTPDMSDSFVKKIPGEDTVDNSSMVFYEDDSGSDTIKAALSKGTTGYVVFFPTGCATKGTPASGDKSETWACIVASNSRRYAAGNEAAAYEVVFTNTEAPVEGTVAA